MKLKNRVALVTGGSRGIGRAIVLALAQEGAWVGINYVADDEGINFKQAKEVAERVKNMGSKSLLLQADVSCEKEVQKMVTQIVKEYGKIEILVNNAGIVRDVTLKKMRKKDWDEVIGVNLTGVFNCVRTAINYMREAGYGRIISISSIIGQTGNIGQSNYAASKAGIMGFVKSIAREVARKGITVNAIAPGFIQTEMLKKIPEEIKSRILQQIPMGRFGTPDDIGQLVVFLVSDEASYITGQTIHINGGLYM